MKYPRAQITKAMVEYFGPDDRRIEHALRVLYHADRLMEQRPLCDTEVVVACAVLHDIGIKVSEEKLGYNNGRTQQQYGPPVAEKLLSIIGFPADKIKKVLEIIGNHHSSSKYDYPELELLKEADQIVNSEEEI